MRDIDKALWRAVSGGDFNEARAALAAGASCNFSIKDGYFLWYEAILADEENVIKLLIDSGLDMNGTDRHGRSAVSFAANMGRLNVLKILLDAGATVDPLDPAGATPLFVAHARTIPLLATRGARLDGVDEVGNTALHYAVWDLDADRVRALLAAGAQPLPKNVDGDTPLDFAAHRRERNEYRWERTMEALAPSIAERDRRALESSTPLAPTHAPEGKCEKCGRGAHPGRCRL